MTSIPIEKDIEDQNYVFPVSTKEIKEVLKNIPGKDLKGLESILIAQPRINSDMNNYGRYDPYRKTVLLFAHYKTTDGSVLAGNIELTLKKFKEEIIRDTIYHEIGHHVGIRDKGDDSEGFAILYAQHIRLKIKRKSLKNNKNRQTKQREKNAL